jgi:hypothetical protein
MPDGLPDHDECVGRQGQMIQFLPIEYMSQPTCTRAKHEGCDLIQISKSEYLDLCRRSIQRCNLSIVRASQEMDLAESRWTEMVRVDGTRAGLNATCRSCGQLTMHAGDWCFKCSKEGLL